MTDSFRHAERGEFWRRRHVFVTGATGLVGSWLIKALVEKGAEVTALVRNKNCGSELFRSKTAEKVHVVQGVVEDFPNTAKVFAHRKFEVVFHLASTNINRGDKQNPLEIFDTNVRGSYNILTAHRQYMCKDSFVLTTSSKEVLKSVSSMGDNDGTGESEHPYQVSKRCAEMICKAFRDTYDTNVAIVRLPNIYGGGDFNKARIVPSVIGHLIKNITPVVHSVDRLLRRYIYVEDVVEAFLLIAELRLSSTKTYLDYEFSEDQAISTSALVEQIITTSGKTHLAPMLRLPIKEKPAGINAVPLTTVESLGWREKTNLKEGLYKTIEWYKHNQELECETAKGTPLTIKDQ